MVFKKIMTEFLFMLVLIEATQDCKNCLNSACDEGNVCREGCVEGFYDKYCDLECPSTCIALKCEVGTTGATVCSEGCKDGYCGSQCKSSCELNCLKCNRNTCSNCTKCRSGLHGKECETSCYEKCQGFECSIDGLCLTTCSSGWYGSNCSRTCSARCATCDRTSGECTTCLRGMYGDACEHHCPHCLPDTEERRYNSQSGCVNCPVKSNSVSDKPNSDTSGSNYQTMFWLNLGFILFTIVVIILNMCFLLRRKMICTNPRNKRKKVDEEERFSLPVTESRKFFSLQESTVKDASTSMSKVSIRRNLQEPKEYGHDVEMFLENTERSSTGSQYTIHIECRERTLEDGFDSEVDDVGSQHNNALHRFVI